MSIFDGIKFIKTEDGTAYRAEVRVPLPAHTWREPTEAERRFLAAFDGRRGVPAYHPTEHQPARCGGTEA